ncbi:MAG: glycoside hydrolase family 130 protein [Isosphaeraceae bacterium]
MESVVVGTAGAAGEAGRLVLRRLGTIMEPEPGNPNEIEGVLNPAAARGPDGNLYLFPRLVAAGNYSRIGIARVRFNGDGDPTGVERLGIALEPEADYELRPDGSGGCEDPRVTFVEPLGRFVMTYTAFSPVGPRIALAVSKDLFHWQRLGLVNFTNYHDRRDPDGLDDKDASLFPVTIPNPSGRPELAILHRPLFPGTRPEETVTHPASRKIDLNRESIWISYCERAPAGDPLSRFGRFASHHCLASPVAPWERLKIGGGAPPILTRHGWLIVYHGVSEEQGRRADAARHLCYSAGVMVLSSEHPQKILFRSAQPVLNPELPQEQSGAIANVVFPTGIDRRDDLGMPDRFDVYYGMADDRIGVARLDLPEALPLGGLAHSPGTKLEPSQGIG